MTDSLQIVKKHVLRKAFIVPAVFGLLLSSAVVFSLWTNQAMGKLGLTALWIGLAPLAALGLSLLARLEFRTSDGKRPAFPRTWLFCLSCLVVLEILLLAILASNYPGFCSTDSNDIANQALGISHYQNHFRYEGLTNHHPVFYTFLFWLTWVMTGSSSDPTFAVFAFLSLQSVALSAGLAWALGWFNRHCASRTLVAFVAALTILSPVLLVHASTMWKDVPFAVIVLVLVLKLFDFANKRLEKRDFICLLCLCLAMSLLRNNGLMVSVALLLYMLAVFTEQRKKLVGVLASLVIVMGVITGPLFGILSVSSGHFAESAGVPLQQIAAIASDDEGVITEEQASFLNNIRPLEELAEAYNPESANPVKFSPTFDDAYLESHKVEFVATWAELCAANPGIALRAWAHVTCGYWQPGYFAGIGSQETLHYEQPVSITGISLNPQDWFNGLSSMFPGLFSMGNVIWIVLAALGVLIVRSRSKSLFKRVTCFIPLLALELTLLVAAPISSDFRYVLGMYLAIPFLLILGNLFGLGDDAEEIGRA